MQCYECAREGEDTAAWVGVVDRQERFCCLECGRQFVDRLELPIVLGVGTWFVEQAGAWPETRAEPSPLQAALEELTHAGVDPLPSPHPIAIIGVKSQNGPPPVTISTREEYLQHFPRASEAELDEVFAPAVVCIIPVPEPLYVGDGLPRIAGRLT